MVEGISQESVERILRDGPSRVVVDSDAEAVSPARAREQYGVVPDVIYIRNDGWSLGAPSTLSLIAERLWKDQWIGMILRPSSTVLPYVPSRSECDFCSADLIGLESFSYAAKDFYISELDFRSLGPWLACPECDTDIRAGRWDSVRHRYARRSFQTKVVKSVEEGAALARIFHNVFRANRLGPVTRIAPRS